MSRIFLFLLALSFAFASVSNDLIKYYNGKLELSQNELDSLCQQIILTQPSNYLVALANYQKALFHRSENQNFRAYETYNQALTYLSLVDTLDNYLNFSIRRNQGVILKYQGFSKEAAQKHREALPFAYAYSIEEGLSVKYNLGWCLSSIDQEAALKILLEVLDEAKREGLKNRQAKTYSEIGDMFIKSKEYEEAAKYFEMALQLAESDKIIAQSYHNLSSVFYYQKKFKKQEFLLLKSLSFRVGSDRFPSLRDLGECYLMQGKNKEAQIALKEAENYYHKFPLASINIRVYEWLAKAHQESSQYWKRLALEFEKFSLEKEKLEALLKQQGMHQLLLRLEAEEKSKVQINFYQLIAVIGIASTLAILLTWRIWWYRLRKQLGKRIINVVSKWEDD